MSLHEVARAAATELHEVSGAGVDTDALLDDLRRTRTRRARSRAVVTGLVVVALGTTGWLALRSERDAAGLPVTPAPSTLAVVPPAENGEIVTLSDRFLRAFDPVTGTRPPRSRLATPSEAGLADLAAGSGMSWSPDGRTFYYPSERAILSLDVTTDVESTVVPCHRCGVAASPDGRTLALTEDGALKLFDLGTKASSTILEVDGSISQPSWSRDGSRIAYILLDPPRSTQQSRAALETVRSDGTGRLQVTDSATAGSWTLVGPSWSADDSTLAVMGVPDGQTEGPIRVFLVPSTGGVPHELMTAGTCFCMGFWPGMTWSPDGAQLAVVGADGLVIVDPQTGKLVRRLDVGAYGTPAWRPVPSGP